MINQASHFDEFHLYRCDPTLTPARPRRGTAPFYLVDVPPSPKGQLHNVVVPS